VLRIQNKDEQLVVSNWIKENQYNLVRLLQEIVRIPSLCGEELAVQKRLHQELETMDLNPEMFYPNETELRKHEEFFETSSFKQYGYENRPNVGGLLKGSGGGRSICFSGHIDVVSPEPLDQWTMDPWSGGVHNGFVYGRGAGDMKAGVVAMIFAVKAIQATGITLRGDVQVETTIEEEDGGVGGVLFMRLVRPVTDAALIPEPSGLSISIGGAGVMYFRVTANGIPALAASAHVGVNAVLKMEKIIGAIDRLHRERQAKISYSYIEVDPNMEGKATAINIGTIQGGDWPSTVPGLCMIECRIGWPPGETCEEIMKQVEDAIMTEARKDDWLKDNPPVIQWFGWKARPHELEPNHRLVKLLMRRALAVSGQSPELIAFAGSLDTRFFLHHNIPALVYGPFAERIHSYDERASIESIVTTAQVYASMIIDWCGVS